MVGGSANFFYTKYLIRIKTPPIVKPLLAAIGYVLGFYGAIYFIMFALAKYGITSIHDRKFAIHTFWILYSLGGFIAAYDKIRGRK